MSLYPPDTIFFLNTWCFGWEDIIKEVARHFNTLVHVDRYKASIFKGLTTDKYLAACITEDHTATRFHACERKHKCPSCILFNKEGEKVYNLDKRIVAVNPVEIKSPQYMVERKAFLDALGKAALGEGLWPLNIVSIMLSELMTALPGRPSRAPARASAACPPTTTPHVVSQHPGATTPRHGVPIAFRILQGLPSTRIIQHRASRNDGLL